MFNHKRAEDTKDDKLTLFNIELSIVKLYNDIYKSYKKL